MVKPCNNYKILMKKLWNFLNSIITWFRSSLEDGKRESSYKRLTIFAFVIVSLYAFLDGRITTLLMLDAYYANLIFISVMAGIIAVPQVIELINTVKNGIQNKLDKMDPSDSNNSDDTTKQL